MTPSAAHQASAHGAGGRRPGRTARGRVRGLPRAPLREAGAAAASRVVVGKAYDVGYGVVQVKVTLKGTRITDVTPMSLPREAAPETSADTPRRSCAARHSPRRAPTSTACRVRRTPRPATRCPCSRRSISTDDEAGRAGPTMGTVVSLDVRTPGRSRGPRGSRRRGDRPPPGHRRAFSAWRPDSWVSRLISGVVSPVGLPGRGASSGGCRAWS